jgi:hypothetical protein
MSKYEIHPRDLRRPGWKQRLRFIALEHTMGGRSPEDLQIICHGTLLHQVQEVLWLRKILGPNELCDDEVYADNKKWMDAAIKDALESAEENAR